MANSARYFATLTRDKDSIDNYYTNSRYAPTGDQQVGVPFPSYKQYGGLMTDWRPAGSRNSTLVKQYNLPTNTNFFRQAMTQNSVGMGANNNVAWVQQTQTLQNVGNSLLCNSDADCGPWPGTTCNKNYEPWPNAKGNQSGAYCAITKYPELESGKYVRKNINEGGIGRGCTTDNDCGQGYSCNNEVDFNGKNVQQTGFCAQKYECPAGSSHYLGYPYNSGIPQPPPLGQNNKGAGYTTEQACEAVVNAQQDCVRAPNGAWYAVYPGYCPVPADLREGGPRGPVMTSGPRDLAQGFHIPAYATNNASNWGAEKKPFESWKISSSIVGGLPTGSTEAWSYTKSLNPPLNPRS